MGVRRTETALIVWTGTDSAVAQPLMEVASPTGAPFSADQFYDAGNRGCGEGPLDDIAGLVRRMLPGQTLSIYATDPSVAVDLAAWARMSGNELAAQQGPYYLIRRK